MTQKFTQKLKEYKELFILLFIIELVIYIAYNVYITCEERNCAGLTEKQCWKKIYGVEKGALK